MPPITPQSSRNGLITATVVFVTLFITSTIFAIYYAAAANKAELKNAELLKTNATIYGPEASSQEVIDLVTGIKADPTVSTKTALGGALNQIHGLARKMTGSVSTTQPAESAEAMADQALAQAATQAKGAAVRPESDSLTGAIRKLSDYAASLQSQLAHIQNDQRDLTANATGRIKDRDAQLQQLQTALDKAQADARAAQQAAEGYHQDETGKIQGSTAAFEAERSAFNGQLKGLQDNLTDLQGKLATAQKQNDALRGRLDRTRVKVEEPLVRRADGQVIQVATADVIYINLGQSDHVTPGLTFEVYDQNTGLPKLGDGLANDELPVGVGSIEIEDVQPQSSRCRVTKLEPGRHIIAGDPIVNLVYDRNVKYNFYVYGNFDIDQNGVPTPQDADKVKQIITQWGGKVADHIDVNTDFVVMGSPKAVPNFSTEELNDPFNRQKYEQALAEQKQYDAVIDQAKDLHIPIMNQNRFLYFCGYYDVARR